MLHCVSCWEMCGGRFCHFFFAHRKTMDVRMYVLSSRSKHVCTYIIARQACVISSLPLLARATEEPYKSRPVKECKHPSHLIICSIVKRGSHSEQMQNESVVTYLFCAKHSEVDCYALVHQTYEDCFLYFLIKKIKNVSV